MTILGNPLPPSLTNSLHKRSSEFIAGRLLAKNALISEGSISTYVRIGESNEPIWPQGFIGSISHKDSNVICAAANKDKVESIGIDIESFIQTEDYLNVAGQCLAPSEYRFLQKGALPTSPNVTTTIIFSAKESIFKALFPDIGFFFGFEVARVISINFNSSEIEIELTTDLNHKYRSGNRFRGHFKLDSHKVLTMFYW